MTGQLGRLFLAATAIVALCTAFSQAGLAQESAPAAAATTAEAEELLPTTLPTHKIQVPDMVTAATPQAALEYNQDELTIMSDPGAPTALETQSLYVLLRRSQMLPEDRSTLNAADEPTPEDLWALDNHLRGKLVKIEGKIARITDLTKDPKFQANTIWWGDKPVYLIDVYEKNSNEPVLIMLSSKPSKLVAPGQVAQFAGIYYKLVNLHWREGGKTQNYPVLVARQVYMNSKAEEWGRENWLVGVAIALVVLAGAWLAVKRSISQRQARRREYQQFRQSQREQAAPLPQDDQPVDEDLVRDVEMFKAHIKKPKDSDESNGKNSG